MGICCPRDYLIRHRFINDEPEAAGLVFGPESRFRESLQSAVAYIESREEAALDGKVLYWMTEKIWWVIRYLMLLELGFEKGKAANMIKRNRECGHAASQSTQV